MYSAGTTVTLKANFKDENGVPFDPTDVTFQLLDYLFRPITEEIPLGAENRTGVGSYFYRYATPEESGIMFIYYEFKGKLNGFQISARSRFSISNAI